MRVTASLLVALLLAALLLPAVATAGGEPEVPFGPLLLHASGDDALTPLQDGEESTSSHSFPLGPASPSSDGPRFQTAPFVRQGEVDAGYGWHANLWASGTGNVWFKLRLFHNGAQFDEVDSDAVELSNSEQEVFFNGNSLPATLEPDDTLEMQWTVSGNRPASDCTVHWGGSFFRTGLHLGARALGVGPLELVSAGTAVEPGTDNFTRRGVELEATVTYILNLTQLGPGSLYLEVNDTGELCYIEPQAVELLGDGQARFHWSLDLVDGNALNATPTWDVTNRGEIFEISFPAPPGSVISADLLSALYLLTLPLMGGIGWWLRGRYRTLAAVAGPSQPGDLPRLLLAGALLVMGINTALVMYSFHSRQLGAREDLVLLHTGLLALTVGGCGSLWGAAADRWGQRRRMMLGALGGAAALALLFPWLSLEAFMAASMLQVALLSSARLAFAAVTEWYPDRKGEAIGLLYAVASLVAALVALAAGQIYDRLLDARGASDAMLGLAALLVPLLLVAAWLVLRLRGDEFARPAWALRDAAPATAGAAPSGIAARLAGLRALFAFESRWPPLILLGVLLVAMPRGAVVLTSLRYFEVRGADVDFSALLEAWAVLMVLILYAVIGKVCDRLGAERVLLWSALAYGGLWSLFALGLPLTVAIVIFVIPIYPMLLVSDDALLARFTTARERNRGLGMAGATALVGQALGIALGYLLMGYFLDSGMASLDAYHWTYRANILLWIAAIGCTWWLSQRLRGEPGAT